jgi:hypothetical protein
MVLSLNSYRGQQGRLKRSGFASLALLALVPIGAHAAQKATTKTEATSEAPVLEALPVSQSLPPRQVEVVVVWGFRLRTTQHDLRLQSVRSGYAELVEKAACINAICGYVVVQDGSKWRATNVISGTERELQDMERNMERDGTTLVLVHPTGQKRTIPNF